MGMPDEYDNVLLDSETENIEEVYPQNITPIPVVLASPAVTDPIYPQHLTAYTLVLTQAAPVLPLASLDSLRTGLTVRALDHDVVLCHSLQQAQDVANLDVALAAPNGAIIPTTTGHGYPLYIRATPNMWIVGNTFPSRVSVVAERRAV